MSAKGFRKKQPSGHALRIIILILLLLAVVFLFLEQNLSAMMLNMAYANANSIALETINEAVRQAMLGGVSYQDLMQVHLGADGSVTMVSANTVRMNELATSTALLAQQLLENTDNEIVRIPLGSMLGVPFLAGSGPRLAVRMLPVGAVSTRFITEFESAGINQTRHRISLYVCATVRLVAPTGSRSVEVSGQISVAENIIVGKVPDSFVDVANNSDMLNLVP